MDKKAPKSLYTIIKICTFGRGVFLCANGDFCHLREKYGFTFCFLNEKQRKKNLKIWVWGGGVRAETKRREKTLLAYL